MHLYFDTNVFIHAFERRADIADRARAAFSLVDDGRAVGVTSPLTLAELLPGPYRKRDIFLAQAYESIFAGREGFEIYPVSLDLLRGLCKAPGRCGFAAPRCPAYCNRREGGLRRLRCGGQELEDADSSSNPAPVRSAIRAVIE